MTDTKIVDDGLTTTTTNSSSNNNIKAKANFSEVQETVSRLVAHKGVLSVLILNQAGDIVTQTGNGCVGNPKLLKTTLQAAARYIQSFPTSENDPTTTTTPIDDDGEQAGTEEDSPSPKDGTVGPFDKLSFVRIRSNREEILVAPKNQYVLVVIQDPALASL